MLKRAVNHGSRRKGAAPRRPPATNGAALNGKANPLTASKSGLQPAIRVVMMPRDANYLGTIFGGVILSSLDLAGAMAAMQHTERRLVTAAMREVKFIAPVFVGDLVSFYTETVKIGGTSITIRVTVEAKRARAPRQTVRVTQAEVVYVAIDGRGKPVPVRS